MEAIQYCQATEADIPLLVDSRIQFLTDFFSVQQSQEDIASLRHSLDIFYGHALKNKTYLCWYAKAKGKVVGVGGMSIREQPGNFRNASGKMGYIMNMYTAPDFRKRGIASTILEKLQSTAIEMGIRYFELHASRAGEPIYVKNGFKQHTEPTYRKRLE